MSSESVVNVYPLAGYSFGVNEAKVYKDVSLCDKLDRIRANYTREGIRRSVEGILLVHEYECPHLLLLQKGNKIIKLPGGHLRPGENEIEGLKRKLTSNLSSNSGNYQPDWKIEECVGAWWRPNFETLMLPYRPPHNTKPKECKKIYVVHLPEKEYLACPKNMKILAVPLFELYNNIQVEAYGPELSSIPPQLSRFILKGRVGKSGKG
ncbi:pre-mRNA cleavage factor Im 25 kDa subunit 2 isoform X3 [Cryptomeria japonica]|uniref:pre-mRNA cleavage factor Im 25 kDa subunit 2 isoform X3 n=1 Tax=Cryptomeria japonica TaxID=3369 RepID=UPI0027DA906B|nr:pre-mRNA cleavage factor Im 25 kDa subunit 2 isoform X3 [Cryptomeria japonica]